MNNDYPAGFWNWVEENRAIYDHFVTLAKQMRARGRKRYGAKGIVEVIRWHTMLRQSGDATFKVNNNYTAGLARLAMQEHPELAGMFATRGDA